MGKNLNVLLTAALVLLTSLGCASMNATHLSRVKPGAAPSAQFQAMSPEARRAYYDRYRLTWDGHSVHLGPSPVGLPDLRTYLEHCGAKDLAQAAESAEPSFRDWSANHPYFNGHVGGRRGGGGNIGGGGDAESTLIIISALVAGSAAYVATDSLLTNIYSTLDPTPSLEDVLEAYNQRLAAALGMDPSDSALVTSMPHALGLSGRDRARSLRLVRAGIACGLIAMIVGSVDLFTTANNGQGTDAWAKPVFFGGAGLLGASLIFGYTEAW